MNKEKVLKISKCAASVLWWLTLVLLALLIVNILSAKMRGEVPEVFGYSVLNIVSGSMEDEIPKGSYILVRKCNPEDIEVGNIITFYSRDPAIYGMPNTHRVMDVVTGAAGREFVTKGDASLKNDSVNAMEKDLVGIYVKRLDGLTAFSNMLSGGGMFVIIILLQIAFSAVAVFAVVKKRAIGKEEAPEEKSKENQK